jgi:hypothetical protein
MALKARYMIALKRLFKEGISNFCKDQVWNLGTSGACDMDERETGLRL